MRICHLNLASKFGGGEVQTLNLMAWLAEAGINQLLVARRDHPLAERVARILPEIEILGLGRLCRRLVSKERRSLVLHAHDGRSLHQVALLAKLFRVPGLATRRVDKGVPKSSLSRFSYRNLDQMVAVSRHIQSRLEESLGSSRCQRIPDSFSGFSCHPDKVSEIRNRFIGKSLIGQIGSLYNIKGHEYTIAAARALKENRSDIHFVFLGEGEERSRLEALAEGLPNVTFVGFVEDVGNWLAVLDLLVHPSLCEGLGSILLEAQQFGVPVIASDVGGISDVVIDGETGLLIPSGNSRALQNTILRVLDDAALRGKVVAGAKEHLREFTPAAVGKAYLKLYQELQAGF